MYIIGDLTYRTVRDDSGIVRTDIDIENRGLSLINSYIIKIIGNENKWVYNTILLKVKPLPF